MKTPKANLTRRSSRRSMVKGTVAGVAGVAAIGGLAAGGYVLTRQSGNDAAHASGAERYYGNSNWDQKAANKKIATIINIAITAEELGVVFYSQAIKHANQLGLSTNGLADIKAAQFEELAHQMFLAKQGAKALTHTFSFPFGQATFTDFNNFIKVQQQLESVFIAAYLAAQKEFAMLRRPDLVLAAAQIGGVEAEHRAVGRAIAGWKPANNRVFETVLLKAVADAPGVVQNAGFLTPVDGNSFTFQAPSMDYSNLYGRSMTDQDWS